MHLIALLIAVASPQCSPLDECPEPLMWWEAYGEIASPTYVDFDIEACEQAAVDACVDAACEDSDLQPEFAVCRVRACVDERTGPTDGIGVVEASTLCVALECNEY